jgi:hypothetical protein
MVELTGEKTLVRHLGFFKIRNEPEIRSMNQKRGDEALVEPIMMMFWVTPEDEQTKINSSSKLSSELGRNSNFDELLQSCRWNPDKPFYV